MYLKSIELCGFKSFADRTKIEFDRQLTAVVGPNGCGKSNVVDAIRWCLGEQSAYSLRSPQMLGIIFGGSQTRQPLGLAEVSLTFDNSSSILPMDYTEITVTRKLFRSGESEYYINKTQCRLKDIRDLFLDTGIGRSGYSIFEQGKVEFIINAKPEERRALFEEAAGVAKYKVRREETLRKLEKVRDDMNRVNDIMSVLKEQTSKLESSVRKARLFKKYQEEFKTLQTADFVKKIDRLACELKPLDEKLEELSKESLARNTQSDTMEAALSELKFEFTRFEKEKSDASARMAALDREIAQCEERLQGNEKLSLDYARRREDLGKHIIKLEESFSGQQKKLNAITSEMDNFEPDVKAIRNKYSAKTTEYEKVRSEIARIQKEINALNAGIIDMLNKKASITNNIARVESETANIAGTRGKYAGELKKVENEKAAYLAEINSFSAEIKKLRVSLEEETAKNSALTSEISSTRTLLDGAREKHRSLREKCFSLETRREMLMESRQKDPEARGVYAILKKGLPGIYGTVSSLLNISSLQGNNVANFLGDKLNYVVCAAENDALKAIEYLSSNSLGFATFIVEERIPSRPLLKELFSFRSEKTLVSLVKCEERWQDLARFLLNDSYASPDAIHSNGCIVFGGDTSGAAVPEVEIKTVETGLSAAKEQLTAAEEEIKSLEQKLSGTDAALQSANAHLGEIKIALASKENALRDKNRTLDLVSQELSVIENDLKRLESDSEEKKNSLAPLNEELSGISGLLETSRGEIQIHNSGLVALRENESRINPELTAIAGELSAKEERMQSYAREKETFLANIKLSRDQQGSSNAEIETLGARIEEMKKSSVKEKSRLDGMHGDKTRAQNEIVALQASCNKAAGKVKKLDEQLSAARNEQKELEEKRHESQLIIRGKEIEKNALEKQLSELGIEFLDAKETYLNIEIEEGQIDRLKRRIESMGNVNMEAQDEYTDLESRYNFLLSQQQDLLKAEEDLRNAIYKINASIKETFQVSFEQVRTNFKSLFSQLFEGGEADIVLTDANNLLESGIDIYAQPPGKKLQSITQCSGGEKALTAIAIVFAFFMVKPSPVCVLDEVDAPLDDANITRFTNLVRSFMQSSQFLVITHNKRTAEAADNIYGVTMEEFGISKIYSLKLQKLETGTPEEKIVEEEIAHRT